MNFAKNSSIIGISEITALKESDKNYNLTIYSKLSTNYSSTNVSALI